MRGGAPAAHGSLVAKSLFMFGTSLIQAHSEQCFDFATGITIGHEPIPFAFSHEGETQTSGQNVHIYQLLQGNGGKDHRRFGVHDCSFIPRASP